MSSEQQVSAPQPPAPVPAAARDLAPSPHLNTLPSPSVRTNQELAQLLANAYSEIETLRRDLSQTKKRADKAERVAHSLTIAAEQGANGASQGVPEATTRIIRDYEERITAAELAREESEARRQMLLDHYSQLDNYLTTLELRAQETRRDLSRIMKEGGGQLVLSPIPLLSGPPGTLTHIATMPPPPAPSSSRHSSSRHATSRSQGHINAFPSALALPPAPTPGVRRHRTPSLDSSYPPTKRARGNDDQRGREPRATYSESHIVPHSLEPQYSRQPGIRVIQAGDKYPTHRPHSRSSSRSSQSSMDVDEMLRASIGDEHPNGAGASPNPHGTPLQHAAQHISSSHRSRRRHGEVIDTRRVGISDSEPVQYRRPGHVESSAAFPASQSIPRKGDIAQPGTQAPFQNHIFAPPVTGNPQKKTKYSNIGPHASTGGIGSIDAPQTASAPAPPVPAFPATNAQGQRICRQCGQPGRFKDGKCVEKWGPGPMGPGTVCDRCRKKMKRVERRATLESPQQQIGSTANLASAPAQQHQPHVANSNSAAHPADRSLQRSDTMPTHHTSPSRDKLQVSGSVTTAPPKVSHVRTIMNPPATVKELSTQPTSLLDEAPTSNVGRGSRVPSRSGSRNPSRTRETNGNASVGGSVGVGGARVRSPADRMEVTDSDADADAEAEAEAEILGAVDATSAMSNGGGRDEEEGDAEADGDAEAELLEAVDAAEANSASSHLG